MSAQVRRGNNIVQLQQRAAFRRFFFENIERRAGNPFFRQGLIKGGLVNNPAPGTVYQHRFGFHQRQLFRSYKVACSGHERHMQ